MSEYADVKPTCERVQGRPEVWVGWDEHSVVGAVVNASCVQGGR